MALSEIGRNIDLGPQGTDIRPVLAFLENAHAGEIYDARNESKKVPLGKIEHVDNIDEFVSREVEHELEAEISRKFPVPVEIRPFRHLADVFVATILG